MMSITEISSTLFHLGIAADLLFISTAMLWTTLNRPGQKGSYLGDVYINRFKSIYYYN